MPRKLRHAIHQPIDQVRVEEFAHDRQRAGRPDGQPAVKLVDPELVERRVVQRTKPSGKLRRQGAGLGVHAIAQDKTAHAGHGANQGGPPVEVVLFVVKRLKAERVVQVVGKPLRRAPERTGQEADEADQDRAAGEGVQRDTS